MIKMLKEKRFDNKRGQIAIFVIVALAIVVAIVLVFLFRDKIGITAGSEEPVGQIQRCIQESVELGVDIVSVQGGAINPSNYILYDGKKIDYLCYATEDLERCVMQKPLLSKSIETELVSFSEDKIKSCVDGVVSSLKDKDYEVSVKDYDIEIDLIPNNIIISLNNIDLTISKGEVQTYKDIRTDINNNIYSLAMISMSIANWEAQFGKADTVSFMASYPWLKIEPKPQDDGSDIYVLTDINTGDKFIFAIRSMVVPVGLTGE